MSNETKKNNEQPDEEALEMREWLESMEYVLQTHDPDYIRRLFWQLGYRAQQAGIRFPYAANTPYTNTIPTDQQPAFPGDQRLENQIKSLVRWNAMAMVVRANKENDGIGGHIFD